MKKFLKRTALISPLAIALTLLSCFGMESSISINNDGSGTARLVYRMSESLQNMGRQSSSGSMGNTDEESFQKSLDRIGGLKLLSWSESKEGKDSLVAMQIRFDTLEALAAFMSGGTMGSGEEEDDKKKEEEERPQMMTAGDRSLTMNFGQAGGNINGLTLLFIKPQLNGYFCDFSFSLPANGTISIYDAKGKSTSFPADWQVTNGRNASISVPMGSLMENASKGLTLVLKY
jgi:hypothetical protein